MYHPTRGGVRGGADQFNWEDVKGDKYRENYLGHSVKAPVGRWQKGKDLSWYSKDPSNQKNADQMRREQINAIKAAEEEAMLAALGHKHIKKAAQPLSKEELAEAFQRSVNDREGERIAGVGKSSSIQSFSSSFNIASKKGVIFQGPSAVQIKEKAEEKSQDESEKSYRSKSKKKKSKHRRNVRKRSHSADSGVRSSDKHRSSSKSTDDGRNGAKSKRRRHDSDSSD